VVISDGQRYVALQTADRELVIVDTRRDTQQHVTVPSDCPPAAMGFGQVVLGCQPSLIDAATGSLRPIAGAASADASGPADEFDAIGSRWLEGTGQSPGGASGDVFVNWHTGERRVIAGHRNVHDLSGPGPPDLNDPQLRDSGRCSDQWIYARAGPWQVISGLAGQLVLQRCRQATRTGLVLDACARAPCGSVQVSGGHVIWSEGASAFAFSVPTKRTSFWRLARFRASHPGDGVAVAQTATRIVLADTEIAGSPPGLIVRFYEANL
jgi:hypothetical protein